jgi:hypothetical protein
MAESWGGARPGAGRKKGGYNTISAERLRIAVESVAGQSFESMLAEMQAKLFQDFKNNRNLKECILFTENISKRLLQMPVQEVAMSTTPYDELSKEELEAKVAAIIATGATNDDKQEDIQDEE